MPNDYDADLVFGTLALEILTFLAPSSRAKTVKSLWVKTEGDKEVATDLLAELVRSTAGVMQVTYAYVSLDQFGHRQEANVSAPRLGFQCLSFHRCG